MVSFAQSSIWTTGRIVTFLHFVMSFYTDFIRILKGISRNLLTSLHEPSLTVSEKLWCNNMLAYYQFIDVNVLKLKSIIIRCSTPQVISNCVLMTIIARLHSNLGFAEYLRSSDIYSILWLDVLIINTIRSYPNIWYNMWLIGLSMLTHIKIFILI